jgi:ABC-type sulfate/molybdate transport systems ATPase subunit
VLDADVEVDRREFTVRAALQVAPGERLALFGPSGAGKSTVLEAIAGLVRPARGRVALSGRVLTSTDPPGVYLPPWQRRVGLLRQNPALFPHLSVRDNLRYARRAGEPGRWGRRSHGRSPGELAQVAEALGISGLLPAMPARLSGGQAHRVALGRLLLAHCSALLLDEPYTGLDESLRRSLTELVAGLVQEREVPAVLVAHELIEAQAFASRLAIIDRGCVLQAGAPDEVVLRPASRRVAELVGYGGFVPAAALDAAVPLGMVRERPAVTDAVAGVHPDRVVPGAQAGRGPVLTGILTRYRPAGAGWDADLAIGPEVITCRLADRPGEIGGTVVVTVLDPPWFGPGGVAIGRAGPATVAGRLQGQEQAGR